METFYKWYTRKGQNIPVRGAIIEDFVCDMPYKEIMAKHGISKDYLYRTIRMYYQKPSFNITLQSAV